MVWGILLALMFHSNTPNYLCTEAFHTAVYLINRLPTSVLHEQSPYQRFFGREPAEQEELLVVQSAPPQSSVYRLAEYWQIFLFIILN